MCAEYIPYTSYRGCIIRRNTLTGVYRCDISESVRLFDYDLNRIKRMADKHLDAPNGKTGRRLDMLKKDGRTANLPVRVMCGSNGIYAGRCAETETNGTFVMKGERAEVTNDCISATALWLIEQRIKIDFEYQSERYILRVEKKEEEKQ